MNSAATETFPLNIRHRDRPRSRSVRRAADRRAAQGLPPCPHGPLAPTLALVPLILARSDGEAGKRVAVPWFALGFLALAALCTWFPLPPAVAAATAQVASGMLLPAVIATGIGSPMRLLLEQGWRASMPVGAASLNSLMLGLAVALTLY